MRMIAALLLLTSAALAEAPIASITGPDKGRPGDIIILSASCADHVDWLVDATDVAVPIEDAAASLAATAESLRAAGFTVEAPATDAPPVYLELDGGKRLLLASYSGVYRVSLAVANADGVNQCAFKVTVSGKAPKPPDPDVPDPPDPDVPLTDLASKVADAVKAKPAAHAELAAVATAYEAVAKMAETGLVSDPDAVVNMTKTLSNAALPTQLAAWQSIVTTVIGPHLNALSEAGKLDTAADHAGPWREIAAGIRQGVK